MNPDELELEFENEERMINEDEIAHLDKIFSVPLKTKEDLLRLAEMANEGDGYEDTNAEIGGS